MDTSVAPVASETALALKVFKDSKRIEAFNNLRTNYLKYGDPVYVILRHTRKSGTARYFDLFTFHGKTPQRITWDASNVTGAHYDTARAAIRMDGCDADAGRQLIRLLSFKLFCDSTALEYYFLGH